ncbi:ankyrin repeat domain-containing protein [Candidatus Babeliales bacterium]|nr:ankyrin repeat domain-containing protein [Candidatus Babeliales bacterium]
MKIRLLMMIVIAGFLEPCFCASTSDEPKHEAVEEIDYDSEELFFFEDSDFRFFPNELMRTIFNYVLSTDDCQSINSFFKNLKKLVLMNSRWCRLAYTISGGPIDSMRSARTLLVGRVRRQSVDAYEFHATCATLERVLDQARFTQFESETQAYLERHAADSAVYAAVHEHDYQALEQLLFHGASPHGHADPSGLTPLNYAVMSSNSKAIQLLKVRGVQAATPLHVAIKQQDLQVIRVLCCFGASLEMTDLYERTPILCAVGLELRGDCALVRRIVHFLACAGARFDVQDRWGSSAVVLAKPVLKDFVRRLKLAADQERMKFYKKDQEFELACALERLAL